MDRAFLSPGHCKYVVDSLNAIHRQMLKLAMENILIPELIWDNSIFFKFMQVHENEEDQAIILSKEAKRILSLILTRNTDKTNSKKMSSFPIVIIAFKT